ncbi:MAG TPA: CBS domain-containing protein [Sphingomicrobium sp.]|jgi:CBS domain-containing protein|nr:CBS domain-containing protein [Sphingomicrobium sp.]
MKAADVMSSNVRSIESTESIADAAHLMGELDVGVLPVVDSGKLVGILTDRDIAVRGFGPDLHSGSPVFRIMTSDVKTCRVDDDLDRVLERMAEEQVRRMPICSGSGEIVGIISVGDLAERDPDKDEVTEALKDICRRGGVHSQQLETA